MKLYVTKKRALEMYPLTSDEFDTLTAAWDWPQRILLDFNSHQEPGFYDDDLAAYVADRDITPAKFEYLRGNLMGMNEAGLKYRLRSVTISRWAKQGILEIKGEDGLKKLVDEADIAYLAKISKYKKIRPGKRIFL